MKRILSLLVIAVAVVCFAEGVQAQTFTKPVRKTSASYFETSAAQQWDEWEINPDAIDSDSEVNKNFGQWRSDLIFNDPDNFQTNPANIWTIASQDSDIDPNSNTFWYYGYTLASIYVQGDAESDAESRFRFNFELDQDGRVVLEGIIGVGNFLGWDQSRDRTGSASCVVKVVDLNTGQNVYRKSISMNNEGSAQYLDEYEFEGETIELPAGKYRLVVNSFAYDSAQGEEVNFSVANAFIELEGHVEQD